MTQTAEQVVRSIRRRCRGPRVDGKHTGCGADFNALILAGPLDGEAHEYECPQCGVTGHYTAPLFPESEGAET